MNGDSILIKETPESSLALSAMGGHNESAVCNLEDSFYYNLTMMAP